MAGDAMAKTRFPIQGVLLVLFKGGLMTLICSPAGETANAQPFQPAIPARRPLPHPRGHVEFFNLVIMPETDTARLPAGELLRHDRREPAGRMSGARKDTMPVDRG
jgi:hypothetical protein